jgi:SMODS-associated and fused to various effectors sensor domain
MPKPKSKTTRKPRVASDTSASEASSIQHPSRSIKAHVTLRLFVQAGGRCEFDSCNRYLLEHHSTSTAGNFGQQAHVVAFKTRGPRGTEENRPTDINGFDNLMLLCGQCHRLIDEEEPEKYPVGVLKKFKADHEERIYILTGMAKNRDTIPLVMKAQIAGRTMEISDSEMQSATAPNVIRIRDKIDIDLSTIPDFPSEGFNLAASAAIDQKIDELARVQALPGSARRVSVFGLASIPLLAYLGAKLSDKWVVDLYQRHRNSDEPWVWREGEGTAEFTTACLVNEPGEVSLLVNVSGKNGISTIRGKVPHGAVYELIVSGQDPAPSVIKTKADLSRFGSELVRAYATIRVQHAEARSIHILAALPAPAAIQLGLMRLPKVDPVFLIYDKDTRSGGLTDPLKVG